jgi:RNA polymerase sigma-70 factor (ECF subfamily)
LYLQEHNAVSHDARHHRNEEFTQTQWTQVVLAALEDGSDAARQALERLCTRYWPAIYGYLRRQGRLPAEAEDLTQGFLAELLATHAFRRADRAKGRFRNLLLGALRRFLADEQRRSGAEKRGRNKVVLALDFAEVEKEYLEEAEPALGPDEAFDRRWAATVLEAAFTELEAEFTHAGKVARFAELSRFLSKPGNEADYAAVAGRLGVSPQTVPGAVCRFRDRYRELVRRTVLETVAGAEEVDSEFQELFR